MSGKAISGKREVGPMTPCDLTPLLLLSNAVQNDNRLQGGVDNE